MTMLELLEESPIIAAIKSWEGLEKSLKSECKVVFVLFGTICDIDQIEIGRASCRERVCLYV